MPAPVALKLTDEITALVHGAVDTGNVMVLAVVDQNQQPLLSLRGSAAVFGPDQLSFWARNAQGGTLDAIAHNPRVAMMYHSPTTPMLEFRGCARIVTDEAMRNRAFELSHQREQESDPERKGVAVVIDLDKISGVLGFGADGPIWCLMERGAGT